MTRILTYTGLYPSAVAPQHGIFVENRLRRIVATGEVTADVIAPVPWFPAAVGIFGRYADFARIERVENRFGLQVEHPRYLSIPKIGMALAPELMRRGTRSAVRRRVAETGAVLIDAHYFYPDGVAAARIGEALGLPVVISARGSDINLIAGFDGPKRRILDAARSARAIIAVSDALRRAMIEIGVEEEKIHVLRNGVDLEMFSLTAKDEARERLGVTRPLAVTVGNVLESKGQDVAIRALPLVPDIELAVVGAGADMKRFERLARELGVADRVRFVGHVPQEKLGAWFAAAEFSVLASMREGWPNVLLESMACGAPAIASKVGGVSEIIGAPEAGLILPQRTPDALAAAMRGMLSDPPDRAATRSWAERFDWRDTVTRQAALYQRVASGRG